MKYWLLVVVLLALVFFVLKFKEVRHKFTHIIILVLLLLTASSVAHIYFVSKPDLTTFDGIVHAGKIYFTWLGGVFSNILKVSGYAVQQDWDPGKVSNITQIVNASGR